MTDFIPIRRALISVSDKTGVVDFARALANAGAQIISTGGTAAALAAAGIRVTPVESITGFPEMMDGRVKTLHPMVHGGLLGIRGNPDHARAMEHHGIRPIDLLCVNLYPFEQTVAKPRCSREDAIENIDIGGPAMIRSAAKNHADVAVVTSPDQYARVLGSLREHAGRLPLSLREDLAREAFAHTARYDAAIAAYLSSGGDQRFPTRLSTLYDRAEVLRYGENPHQAAALYRTPAAAGARPACIASAQQLHGKELSFNNLNDAQAALSLVLGLRSVDPALPAAAVVKHTNPCGASMASTLREAVDHAIAGDPVAAYGGILAVNSVFDARAAERLQAKDVFFEVIVAPGFTEEALGLLRARWMNVRLLAVGDGPEPPDALEARSIPGGLLVQERDRRLATAQELVLRAGPEPGAGPRRTARFLEVVVRGLFSNAVVIGGGCGEGAMRVFGAGAGQMDRVTSCRLAVEKAGPLAQGAVCVSDAFFPFADGPQVLIGAGVSTIVHPGGSKRDQDTFDLCAARGVACLTTGLRHFRH